MRPTLPSGWQWVPLSRLVSKIEAGKSFKCEERPPVGNEAGIVKVSAVTWGTYDEEESKTIRDPDRVNEAYLIRPGDFLFSRANTLQLVGACVLVRTTGKRLLLSDKILRLVMPDVMKPWLLWFLRSAEGRRQIEGLSTGNQESMRNIGQERIGQIEVPIPAMPTMQLIVSRIEELFSEIDEGERALERVQKLVERYRQSVLKAAVTGELTVARRHLHGHGHESGEALLEQIATAARRRPGRGQLEVRPGDLTNLPRLPEKWAWARAEAVCDFITKGTTPPASAMHADPSGVPFIKVYNLTFDGSLDFSIDPTFVDEATHSGALSRSRLVPGDVLMNIVGPPLGKVSVVPATRLEWNMNQAISVFRPLGGIDRRFLAYYLLSRVAQDWLASRAKATVGQVNLTLEICRDLPIPIPPSIEQLEVVQLAATELARLDNLSGSLMIEVARGKSLRQAVLKAAFSGALVPQDPTDEPAAALLSRLAAHPGDAACTVRRGGRKPRQAAATP